MEDEKKNRAKLLMAIAAVVIAVTAAVIVGVKALAPEPENVTMSLDGTGPGGTGVAPAGKSMRDQAAGESPRRPMIEAGRGGD